MVHLLKTVQPNLTTLSYPHFLPFTDNADGVCISKSAACPDPVTFIVFSDSVEETTKICKSGAETRLHYPHFLPITDSADGMACVFLRV